jgi:hypothetical protein
MAEKASGLAKWAFGISILTAAFSIFQWWNQRSETRIAAAIEISKNFFKDIDFAETKSAIKLYAGKGTTEDEMTVARQADYLNYVALLANHHQIDERFLAGDIVCMMAIIQRAVNQMPGTSKVMDANAREGALKELTEFVKRSDCSRSVDDAISRGFGTKPN